MTLSRLRWLYGAQGVSLGLLLPFLLPLLVERGLGAGEIGLVLGASGLVSLMAYPLWGLLADGWLGRRRSIAVAGAGAAAGGALLLAAGNDPLALTAAISLALLGALPWGPLSDALALASLGDGSAGYGRLRAWASLGWAGSAVTAGVVWTIFGSAPVFLAFSVSALLVSILVLPGIRRTREVASVGAAGGADGAEAGGAHGADAGDPGAALHEAPAPPAGLRATLPLLASPVLVGFLVGLLLASVGEHASWRFVGLRILDQGGGLILLGLAAALPALVEIPVFTGSRRLARRLGLRMIFVWGTVISASLTVLIALASEAWMVTLLRTIDGTSFALRYLGMVLVIGVLLPRSMQAIGQSLGWLMLAGFAPIIADTGGGLIYEQYGGTALFLTAAAMTLAGGAIVYLVLRAPRFGRVAD